MYSTVLKREQVGARFGFGLKRAGIESAVFAAAAAAYYLGCLAGFALRFPSSGISFFWPPNAILTTAFLILAPSRWPIVLAGTFLAHGVAHIQDGIPLTAWPIQYFGNALQALVAVWVIRRFGSVAIFADFRRVLIFVVGGCIVAPAVASLAPSYIYVSLGWAPDFFEAWRARVVSNTVSTLTIVPSLLMLWRMVIQRRVVRARRVAEFVVLLLGLVATHGAVRRADLLGLSLGLYAMTPFLLWATLRFGGTGLSWALSTTLLITSKAAIDMSPVAGGVPADAVIGVQLLLTATAIPLLLLGGLLEQQRAEHRTLVDVERQNRAILRALPDTTLLHTRDGAILQSYPGPIDDVSKAADATTVGVPPAVAATMTTAQSSSAERDEPRVTEYTQVAGSLARRYEARSIAVDTERMLTIIRDITDRWRSEQVLRETQHRYALATSVGTLGVWDYDVAAGTFHVEGTLKAALGYGEDEIADTLADWQSVIFEADRDEALARLSALVNGDAQTVEAEFRLTHKDQSLRWIACKGAVTSMRDGKALRVVGTYVDVTERKESARALRQANDTLVRMGRIAAMGEATASLAHELSQPLTAITANTLACLRTMDAHEPTAFRETLNDVLRDSRLASQIVHRTHRLFANRSTELARLHLNDVVREVVKVAAPRLRELHVRVTQALDPDLPHVFADMIQMQQVLFNLIVNGADAMSGMTEEPRALHISSRRGKRHVVVSVRDRGAGLPQADTSRLFEPFYTTKPGGSGMGLAISRSIVHGHSGTLWAVSNRDRGSTFRFKIPILTRRAGAEPGRARKVLLVNDRDRLSKSLTPLIHGWGHHVAVAATCTRALTIAQRFRPDVAVIDVSLDDTMGLQLARRLRAVAANRQLLMIALTAHEDLRSRQACFAAGFDVCLARHTHASELEELLARMP
jgi:PAS domain S-box-containing protein